MEMTGCIEHGQARDYAAGKRTTKHREVWCAHNNVPLDDIKGLVVRHKCDNPRCINPKHLEIGTQSQNLMDRHRSGRAPTGSKHSNSKLVEADVIEIRKLAAAGVSKQKIASKYNVSRAAIRQLLDGRSWKYV